MATKLTDDLHTCAVPGCTFKVSTPGGVCTEFKSARGCRCDACVAWHAEHERVVEILKSRIQTLGVATK